MECRASVTRVLHSHDDYLIGGAVLGAADAVLSLRGISIAAGFRTFWIVMLAGGAVGAAGLLESLRRSCQRLIRQLREAPAQTRRAIVPVPTTAFPFFSRAVNELQDACSRSIAEANLRAKELEIQLKVATAERQHAEAIIYSISDAVLVTDPFDELVLANESAARTFDFDLNKAARSPVDQVLRDPKMIELIREMRQSNSRTGRRIVEHQVRTPPADARYKITLSCVLSAIGGWHPGRRCRGSA